MRSRTEMVTTQLEGSEFEDESDFEDSEEDWQPAKGEQKPKKMKTTSRGKKSPGGNQNGAKKRGGRKPAKKSKKKSSDVSDDDTSEPEPAPVKKSRKTPKKPANLNDSSNDGSVADPNTEPTTSKASSPAAATTIKPQPLQRMIVTPAKSFPDKGGFLNLYLFKGDLKDGIANNPQVCLWRRDGSSLLQKYLRDKTVQASVPQFNSSMVYSCWEDRRADEYLEVKVKCLEQSKQIRVELTDIEELERKSKEEYDNYVAAYGTPVPRSSKAAANDAGAGDEEDEDDEEGDEDDMDETGEDGVDGEGEEYAEEDDETGEVPQEE